MTIEARHACTYCGADAEGQSGWTATGRVCEDCTWSWARHLEALLGTPCSWNSEGLTLSWIDVQALLKRVTCVPLQGMEYLGLQVSEETLRRAGVKR